MRLTNRKLAQKIAEIFDDTWDAQDPEIQQVEELLSAELGQRATPVEATDSEIFRLACVLVDSCGSDRKVFWLPHLSRLCEAVRKQDAEITTLRATPGGELSAERLHIPDAKLLEYKGPTSGGATEPRKSKLPQSFDGRDWAREFMQMWGGKLNEIDEDLMLCWFCNAIMAGYDHRERTFADRERAAEAAAMEKACAKLCNGCAAGHPLTDNEFPIHDWGFTKAECTAWKIRLLITPSAQSALAEALRKRAEEEAEWGRNEYHGKYQDHNYSQCRCVFCKRLAALRSESTTKKE